MGRTQEVILTELLSVIEQLGADKLECQYSGGNDEGGVGHLSLSKDGEEILMPDDQWGTLLSLADELLSTKYGDWAWEGSAWGIFHVSVPERRAWEEGSETYEQVIPIGDALSVNV